MTIETNDNRRDTTITDIHKIRERISETFHGDIHAITEDAKRRQEKSGHRTVSYAKIPLIETPETHSIEDSEDLSQNSLPDA